MKTHQQPSSKKWEDNYSPSESTKAYRAGYEQGRFDAEMNKENTQPTPTIDSVVEIRKEFTKWHSSETTFAIGVPDDRTIADWWLEKLSQQQSHHEATMREEYEKGRRVGFNEGMSAVRCQTAEEARQSERKRLFEEMTDFTFEACPYEGTMMRVFINNYEAIASRRGIPLVDKE